jgi:hypothetical protein
MIKELIYQDDWSIASSEGTQHHSPPKYATKIDWAKGKHRQHHDNRRKLTTPLFFSYFMAALFILVHISDHTSCQ